MRAHECRTPSLASTRSSCWSGSPPTPPDDAALMPQLCAPLSPPLTQSNALPASRPPVTISKTRTKFLRRPKLPRCLRFRDAAAPSPSPRCLSTPRTSCQSLTPRDSSVSSAFSNTPLGKHRSFGTVLLQENHQDLDLFRDEAEYSDYLMARLTGNHTEVDGVVYYEIELHLSRVRWIISRRYSEFRALRQQLIKHFARRQRAGTTRCAICENILESIQAFTLPSRRKHEPLVRLLSRMAGGFHSHHHQLNRSSSSSTFSETFASPTPRTANTVETRKCMFQGFVGSCLLTVRSLRQHFQIMPESSSACEISVALRLIEEFFGLNFTRYLAFLNERGVDVEP